MNKIRSHYNVNYVYINEIINERNGSKCKEEIKNVLEGIPVHTQPHMVNYQKATWSKRWEIDETLCMKRSVFNRQTLYLSHRNCISDIKFNKFIDIIISLLILVKNIIHAFFSPLCFV